MFLLFSWRFVLYELLEGKYVELERKICMTSPIKGVTKKLILGALIADLGRTNFQ